MLRFYRLFGGVAAAILLLALFLLGSLPHTALAQEVGYNNGFYIHSKDGQFKFTLNGRLQLQELIQKIDGAKKTPRGATSGNAVPSDFSDTFMLRRALLAAGVTLYDRLSLNTQFLVSTPQTSDKYKIRVMADMGYAFSDAFRVTGGVVTVPFDRPASSAWFLGVEPPLTATQSDGRDVLLTIARDSFGAADDLGVIVEGDVGKHFSYGLGVVNGGGYEQFNANNELSWGGRVAFHVLDPVPARDTDYDWSEKPRLTFGLGTTFEDEDAADKFFKARTRLWSWQTAGDAAFRYKGFSLNGALYHRFIRLDAATIEDTNRDRKLRDIGYAANTGYFVIPKKLELMLTASQIFREGPDNNANEFGGGLNWYIKNNNAKFQVDYTNVLDYDDVPGLNNATYHRVRMMFSVMF